jgi:hypothetical protein
MSAQKNHPRGRKRSHDIVFDQDAVDSAFSRVSLHENVELIDSPSTPFLGTGFSSVETSLTVKYRRVLDSLTIDCTAIGTITPSTKDCISARVGELFSPSEHKIIRHRITRSINSTEQSLKNCPVPSGRVTHSSFILKSPVSIRTPTRAKTKAIIDHFNEFT